MYKKWFKSLNNKYSSFPVASSKLISDGIQSKKLWDLLQWRNQFYIGKSKAEMDSKTSYLKKLNIYTKIYGHGEHISLI
jgi:hypothetical protein